MLDIILEEYKNTNVEIYCDISLTAFTHLIYVLL